MLIIRTSVSKKKLLDSAFKLFIDKGYENTTIDEIVKKANLAKGTFYIYFKNKYDIVDALIIEKGSLVLEKAISKLNEKKFSSLEDEVIFLLNDIIEYFRLNKLLLKFLDKNISWGLYENINKNYSEDNKVLVIFNHFIEKLLERGMEVENAKITIYLIFELVGAVTYNSIILNKPANIDFMKPIVFKQVRKMLV